MAAWHLKGNPMAGLEQRNGNYNIIIRYGWKRFIRSLKTKDETESTELKQRIERRQRLIETGDLSILEHSFQIAIDRRNILSQKGYHSK